MIYLVKRFWKLLWGLKLLPQWPSHWAAPGLYYFSVCVRLFPSTNKKYIYILLKKKYKYFLIQYIISCFFFFKIIILLKLRIRLKEDFQYYPFKLLSNFKHHIFISYIFKTSNFLSTSINSIISWFKLNIQDHHSLKINNIVSMFI